MSKAIKTKGEILQKLGISSLNEMQIEAQQLINSNDNVILLSPTGSGKTLAFLLPIISNLDPSSKEIQALILLPSRELAIQIEQVIREMGTGFKANAIYGGRTGQKDKIDLKHPPAILIGTPGRIADRMRRDNISATDIKTVVLDEFDKSLEIGFEQDMKEILGYLRNLNQRVLTSATRLKNIPEFVGLRNPVTLDYLHLLPSKLKIKSVLSKSKNKYDSLASLLEHIGDQPGIIFCNFKDSIRDLSDFLESKGIKHGCFYGGMEQIDRERVLIKFRNGTQQIIIATDLAARGLDIPALKFIIHFELPPREEEFIHRNGRTARMNADGTAYVLSWENDRSREYIKALQLETCYAEELKSSDLIDQKKWVTLFISGGRKDKISKGDIAGLFFKQGHLKNDELGNIELKSDCAFVAVDADKVDALVAKVNNVKLKKKKVRIRLV
jgi:superfamily II DNA/RNA helicase